MIMKLKRALTTLSVLTLVLGGCDHADTPSPGFLSGMGMTSGASTASAGYGMTGGEVTFGSEQSGDSMSYMIEDWIDIPQGTPITVDDGALSGDYGHVDIPAPVLATVAGYSDGYWTEVNLMVETQDGVSMAIFEVWGGLETLETGASRNYARFGDGDHSSTYVSVIGCAGDVAFDWDYDGPATEVTVTVTEDPNDASLRVYEFTAHFEERSETWQGETIRYSEMTGRFVGPTNSPAPDLAQSQR
jgi:hypothetical protein